MALDQRLVGGWTAVSPHETSLVEITPTGKYFVHNLPVPFLVSPDGKTLSIQGWEVFTRVGTPDPSIVGTWEHNYVADNEIETWIFNADGSYVGHWDQIDYFWGFYLLAGQTIRTMEYRALWSTNADQVKIQTAEVLIDNRFIFESADVFKLCDMSGTPLATYTRTVINW